MEESGLKEGDEVTVKLVEIDPKTGKFRLSMKELQPRPEGMPDVVKVMAAEMVGITTIVRVVKKEIDNNFLISRGAVPMGTAPFLFLPYRAIAKHLHPSEPIVRDLSPTFEMTSDVILNVA